MGRINKEEVEYVSPGGIEVMSSNLVDWFFLQKGGKRLYSGNGKDLKPHTYATLDEAIKMANSIEND